MESYQQVSVSDSYIVPTLAKPVIASIKPPGSKSITNRALLCAALANGKTTLNGCLRSDDTRVMINALSQLGLNVGEDTNDGSISIEGQGGSIASGLNIFVENSGTTIRFLTGALSVLGGRFTLDGIARMRERPILHLVDALNQLDCGVSCGTNGCPPVQIDGSGAYGGEISVRGDFSSQFLSGLLMALPYASEPVTITIDGTLVSIPYVQMTIDVMASFGICVSHENFQSFSVAAPLEYHARAYDVEPDASAASYFMALAAATGSTITIEGIGQNSIQGDIRFADVLEEMGCEVTWSESSVTISGRELVGIDVDMNGISDTVQTLAVLALFARGPTKIRNVGHIRHKETDRLAALAIELAKLGATIIESSDTLEINPGPLAGAKINTYNDHRMAMSFAIAGLRIPDVELENPGCCEKTYPEFFNDLQRVISADSGSA